MHCHSAHHRSIPYYHVTATFGRRFVMAARNPSRSDGDAVTIAPEARCMISLFFVPSARSLRRFAVLQMQHFLTPCVTVMCVISSRSTRLLQNDVFNRR